MFKIPTLTDLVQSCRSAFRTELTGTDAWLWPNNVGPAAKVIGGGLFEIYGRLDYVQRQKFALTADGEWLDRHGSELGLSRLPAAPASGSIVLTATTALVVSAGATFTRSDGTVFVSPGGGTLAAAGSLTVSVVAQVFGAAGITAAGAPLTAASGVVGSATVAVGTDGLTGGADAEGDEAYRARILFRKRFPPSGGSAADYVGWAMQVPGVTRVFIERLWAGPGTVRVFPLTDGATANGIPSAAVLAQVAAVIDSMRPVGALVTVAAATPVTVNVQISGLSPNTLAVREAIAAELRDAFTRLGRVSGSEPATVALPFLAKAQTFSRSWIWQAIANAAGEERHVLLMPSADVPIPAGSLAVLGTISFV